MRTGSRGFFPSSSGAVASVRRTWHIARMARLRAKSRYVHSWRGGTTTKANAALIQMILVSVPSKKTTLLKWPALPVEPHMELVPSVLLLLPPLLLPIWPTGRDNRTMAP